MSTNSQNTRAPALGAVNDKTDSKEREAFEASCKKLFACTEQSFRRDNGAYYNTVARSHPGQPIGEYACVSMLWGIWQARASLAANAGSEPVAFLVYTEEGDPDMVFLSQHDAQQYLEDHERPTPLYTHPSPPEGMVGGWISVDERLPEAYVTVLLTIDAKYVTTGEYLHNLSCFDLGEHDDETDDSKVTHWMPLPPPPTSSADSRKGE